MKVSELFPQSRFNTSEYTGKTAIAHEDQMITG